MGAKLQQEMAPELVFGLVAPIGVDLDLVTGVLEAALREMEYDSKLLKLTSLMTEIEIGMSIDSQGYIESIQQRIRYANAVRTKLGDDALAALAISAIRALRGNNNTSLSEPAIVSEEAQLAPPVEEAPLQKTAYIIRQFKKPEEVMLLRTVYGKQFVLISVYAPEDFRTRKIEGLERKSRGGVISDEEAHASAHSLVRQDANENSEDHGQNVRDAFPLGDVFIDATVKNICEETIRRFVRALFGSNEVTPTRDEYGMYMAKSASLRSSDLSRQVGAAICRPTGEILTLGSNEVPKFGGGTYWTGCIEDGRDFSQGYDANDDQKREVLSDLVARLKDGEYLAQSLAETGSSEKIVQILLEDKGGRSVSESRLMDIIEFGRIIHAEMSAISDAARLGIAIQGATLICTTFPCHLCAKHIVASGISRVLFLQPYPKSYAANLHNDSISVGKLVPSRVSFEPFIGISPYRYRDLFEKGKRKYSGGSAQQWNMGVKRPMIEVYHSAYVKLEAAIVDELHIKLMKTEAG